MIQLKTKRHDMISSNKMDMKNYNLLPLRYLVMPKFAKLKVCLETQFVSKQRYLVKQPIF